MRASFQRSRSSPQVQQAESDLEPLPFDVPAARAFGRVALALRKTGRAVKPRAYDVMIAATALANGLPLYTCNPKDFKGIDGLTVVRPGSGPGACLRATSVPRRVAKRRGWTASTPARIMTGLPPAAAVALGLFVGIFALATLRGVHVGLLMFVAASAVGPTLAGMSLRDVVAGFPVSIMILVAGVTYFFGIAQLNGTLDRVMGAMLARTAGRRAAMPLLFFLLAAAMAAMGSPQAGLATGPVGMSTARRAGVDPVLMAVAINSGICAGAFAPTSLFGIITYGIARQAGIEVTTLALLGVSVIANLALLAGALVLFSRRPDRNLDSVMSQPPSGGAAAATNGAMSRQQRVTAVCVVGLVPGIIGSTLLGVEPDIGVVLLSLGALLALMDPAIGARAFARIDWSTAFVVAGIVTYVGVLQRLDAVNGLGRLAMNIGTPLLAALVICMIAALVSAFASTTAVLAALVPMAVPLAASGAVPGWALITTLGVSATIVDASPFSNTGATLIAAAPEDERSRLRVMLLRWSMAMVLVGPIVLLPLLLALAR